MGKKEDVDKLLKYYEFGNPFSLLQIDNKGLLMFYCMKYNKNDVYYVEQEDAVVIAGHENEAVVVYDIFSKSNSGLENILQAVANDNTQKVYFGFPLIKTKHCKISKYEEEDNILFILNKSGSEDLSEFLHISDLKNEIMFPLLTHS